MRTFTPEPLIFKDSGVFAGTSADHERVKQTLGLEEAERAVEDAKRREEQAREQKKAKRKFSGGKVTDSGRALLGTPS